jgi:hypothetical protein
MALHQVDALERLESANENRRGGPGGLTDDVEHEVRAVVEENVCVTGSEIHGANARRGTAEVMTSGIAGRVCFRFDDAATEASTGKIVDDHFADEKAGEGDSIDREFRAAKTADGEYWIAFVHGGNCLPASCAAGAGQEFLQVFGGNEIVVFRMPSDKRGNVRAQRHDAEMIGASEIERGTGKFGGEALALKGRGNFGVVEDDTARKAAIGEKCAQAVDLRFKALTFFVVCDDDAFEVQIHESPCGFFRFFIPEITEGTGRTLIDLLDDAIAG